MILPLPVVSWFGFFTCLCYTFGIKPEDCTSAFQSGTIYRLLSPVWSPLRTLLMEGVSQQAAVCSRPGSYKKIRNGSWFSLWWPGPQGGMEENHRENQEPFLEAKLLWVTTRCFCPASGFCCTAPSALPVLLRSCITYLYWTLPKSHNTTVSTSIKNSSFFTLNTCREKASDELQLLRQKSSNRSHSRGGISSSVSAVISSIWGHK